MKNLAIVLTFFLVWIMIGCKPKEDSGIKIISPEEMHTFLQLDNVQFIDVRTPEEHEKEFIATSQNIDFSSPSFLEDISKLDKNKPVLLYCKTGRRSNTCAQKLVEAGFVKIYDLQGGISKWKHDGYEVDTKL
ncbi:rhodanese-like domain-containing protein [Mariniflexile ostreae]|uniref:Rhodanese-like domain-containing protein n=1 Tax=Mariniflexile ostreae TaxID=1520892 RepID=A0ABV5FD24_9FLAO